MHKTAPENLKPSLISLSQWFEKHKRVLPWRDDPSVYRVWVSEIMLQQTQVAAVIPYFEKFLSLFPTVEELASSKIDGVLTVWSGLGYYSRARNLHLAAQKIVRAGGFPDSREGWLELPGVGEYTAGAVLSIALDYPEAILDANVKRVISRLRRLETSQKVELWKWSKLLVETAHSRGIRSSVFNQALMELGALVCLPQNPNCVRCPLSKVCQAYIQGDIARFSGKLKKDWKEVKEDAFYIRNNEGLILLRRSDGSRWRKGLWDLPESLPEWLSREDLVSVGNSESRYVVTNHKVIRNILIFQWNGPVSETGMEGWRWMELNDIVEKKIPAGSPLKRMAEKIEADLPY